LQERNRAAGNRRGASKELRKPNRGRVRSNDEDRARYDRKTEIPEREEYFKGEERNENVLEGRNPIREALKSGRSIERILVARGELEGSVRQVLAMARERKIVIQEVERSHLDELAQSGAHQGIIAIVSPYRYVEVEDILRSAREKEEDPFVIILDEITDPHNLGSVIRTAECCGAHGVIIPKRRAVGLTPAVAKSSSGAVEYVPVAKVTNIAVVIEQLKKEGLWIAGADMGGGTYFNQDLKGPLALVIGSEGTGIGRLIKEKCDFLVSIPLKGRIESLNASVAAAILMYEVVRQRAQ